MFEPGYLALYRSGELEARAGRLRRRLAACDICPRRCGVNRLEDQRDFCRSGRLPIVASVCDHHGEEPAISGTRGSGTIFFRHCNLKCVYCQNHQISQGEGDPDTGEIDCSTLAERMVYLQTLGCHNINLVSPSHFVPQIVEAVLQAVPLGLTIPLVYNTNAYDAIESLKELEGIIDIYLPDVKYASDSQAMKYSQAHHYVESSRAALKEMHRQVGRLVPDPDGIAQRGLIIRHLILPNDIAGSPDSLSWLARELSPEVTVSIMAQYFPCHRASRVPLLSRRISLSEFTEVASLVEELGFENGWVQELDAAENYLPDFEREGHPFKD
ncbi:MAG: radical SAM protein [Chloroflexi bacterium]|nr:radical SAM protein [Chloroflexota bacterium]